MEGWEKKNDSELRTWKISRKQKIIKTWIFLLHFPDSKKAEKQKQKREQNTILSHHFLYLFLLLLYPNPHVRINN